MTGKSDRAHLARFTDLVAKLMAEANLAPPARMANQFGPARDDVRVGALPGGHGGLLRDRALPDDARRRRRWRRPTRCRWRRRAARWKRTTRWSHISFDEARHVYDIRAHEYLGHTDHIDTKLSYGDAKVYARLPYTVDGGGGHRPGAR